jgi:Ser/Thr protein kinase RdoA (MazF antagonist)
MASALTARRESETLAGALHADDTSRALAVYPQLRDPRAEPLRGGLIHRTYAVRDPGGEYVLQRVSPIFSTGIHENIAAVCAHLKARGFPTYELLTSSQGRGYAELADGSRWRLLTRLPGVAFDRCAGGEQARAAGALVARFHAALADLEHRFRPLGIVLHDPPAHLRALDEQLAARPQHRLAGDVGQLAQRIRSVVAEWQSLDALPLRVAHGDLKFNNLLFAGTDATERERPVALIDLDTVSPLPLWAELGDAWRSWCNRVGEEQGSAALDLSIFYASAEGYLGALSFPMSRAERESLALGLERISLELATRFAVDALVESYFGWDPARFPAAGEHNLLRARAQLALWEQARETRAERMRFIMG